MLCSSVLEHAGHIPELLVAVVTFVGLVGSPSVVVAIKLESSIQVPLHLGAVPKK